VSREVLFKLRPLKGVTITAFDDGYDARGATKYRLRVVDNGETVFDVEGPHAVLWGAFSPLCSCDGDDARRGVLTHVAMKPGDTDRDFFADYSRDQLEWVECYGEELSLVAFDRYGEG
jgi:hypothetical protein